MRCCDKPRPVSPRTADETTFAGNSVWRYADREIGICQVESSHVQYGHDSERTSTVLFIADRSLSAGFQHNKRSCGAHEIPTGNEYVA